MACPFDTENLDKLKLFINLCRDKPETLHNPSLAFVKDFIESFGGKIPEKPTTTTPNMSTNTTTTTTEPQSEEIESEDEPEPEIDREGCVTPDLPDPKQLMGDVTKLEINEADIDKADTKRREAMLELAENNLEKAIDLLTDAIELNPQSGLLYAKRGQTYLKLIKPNACIRDCTRGLELNPDSAGAYKYRGRAYRLLGEWEKSAQDLRQACNIDLDEEIDEWLKEVEPKAQLLRQYRMRMERKRLEMEEKDRVERVRKAREAHASAAAAASAGATAEAESARDAGFGAENIFSNLMQDPTLMTALKDPDVAAALADITTNPANFFKYKSNPKIMKLMASLSSKFGGGGIPFAADDLPGGDAGAGAGAAPPNTVDDDNLD